MNRRMIVIAPWAVALALAPLSQAAAQTTCSSTPAPRSTATRPALIGRMVYQSSTALYLTDFAAATTTQISFSTSSGPTPVLSAPSNANFSPDGRWIVFYAQWTPSGGSARTDVFISRPDGSHLVDLTVDQDPTQPEEDPRFAQDGATVFYKRIYFPVAGTSAAIMKMTVSLPPVGSGSDPSRVGSPTQVLAMDGVQYSKPSPSPTGKYVYYFSGTTPNEGVYQLNVATGASVAIAAVAGVQSYYPAPRDLTTTFYVSWANATNHADQIYANAPGIKAAATQLSLNDANKDDSDPAKVDEDYIIFSSDRCNGDGVGHYKLFVGQPGTTKYWTLDLDHIEDPVDNLLGADFTLTPTGP